MPPGCWQCRFHNNTLNNDSEKFSYLQLFLEPGKHEVTLEHTDPFAYKDIYELVVGNDTVYVKIFRRVASNGFEVVDELPVNFARTFKSVNL